jgi:hypothetical protein
MSANNTSVHVGVKILLLAGVVAVIKKERRYRNAYNTCGCTYKQGAKNFVGGNANLQGKVFEINRRDAAHQYTETIIAIADYVGQEYTHRGGIHDMIKNLEDCKYVRLEDPEEDAHQCKIESWTCFGSAETSTKITR